MERFTSDRLIFRNQIELELSEAKGLGKLSFQYLEMSQLLTHGFSFSQKSSQPNELLLRTWNAEFDKRRFATGIYNLDRLSISEKTIRLSEEEQLFLNNQPMENIELSDWNGMVIDGLRCQLKISDRKLVWNCNDEINHAGIELVEFLRSKTG